MSHLKWLCGIACLLLLSLPGQAQLLKKLKDKAEQIANKAVGNSVDNKVNSALGLPPSGSSHGPGGSGPGTSGGGGGNNTGAGLISTPPDVNQNLTDADAAFKKNQYGDARYSTQQAMLGVELMIGREIIKGLPAVVATLPADTSQDKVTSTGWGWAGLTIQRTYHANDKRFDVTIANNAVWMAAINMYFGNGGYAQQTNEQQNWKQVKIKGYKAIIEFDKSSGYKLSVPLGQTSLLMYDGVNFATEPEFMAACNEIDIDRIKKQLGEQ